MKPEDYTREPDPWFGRLFNRIVNALAWLLRA